jgi:hypothetical protein
MKINQVVAQSWLDLLQKPKEIRAFLDQYVNWVKIKLKSNVGCSLQSLQTFDATTRR